MSHGSKAFRFCAAFAASGMVLSSTAHAAPSSFSTVDPLVSLSVFGTSASRAAVCAAGAQAASAAATAGAAAAVQAPPGPGCVLPVLDAVPPPVVQTVPVVPVATGGGFNLGSLLPLLGIAALGGLAILLLENDEDEGPPPLSPV